MATRIKLTPAYILHRKPYRESSYLVDLFTKEHGKIRGITRGMGKQKKGLIQPFTPLLVSWNATRELVSITQIEASNHPPHLLGKPLICAFYVNELLTKTTAYGDPQPELFAIYIQTLTALAQGSSYAIALRQFEKQLLDTIGYGLPLQSIMQSDTPASWYQFHPEQGFSPCDSSHPQALAYQTLHDLHHNRIADEPALKACKRLLQSALRPVLARYHINTRMLWSTEPTSPQS
jgi:DNA repair protein RecO (recombination protein O)